MPLSLGAPAASMLHCLAGLTWVLLCRVPLYYEAKIVFIVWLTLPQFQVRVTCS